MRTSLYANSILAMLFIFCLGCNEGERSRKHCHEVFLDEFVDANYKAENIKVEKRIWTFWDKGEEQMPAFHRFNVQNWRAKLNPKGYQIVVANTVKGDPNNIATLLDDKNLLPEFFFDMATHAKPYKDSNGKLVHFRTSVIQSDFVRLALLEKFGGVWMDSSDLLVRDLDEILKEFEKSAQSVAGFVEEDYSSSNSVKVNGKHVDGLENWMLAAKKNSPLIKAWRKVFTEYWRIRKDERINENPIYCNDFDFGGLGSAPNYLNQHAALKYVVFHQPSLGKQIFHLELQPWWLGDHATKIGSDGGILVTAIGPYKFNLAQQAYDEGAMILKFANHRTPLVNKHFKKAEDFCTIDNFFAKLYELSMKNPWCKSRL